MKCFLIILFLPNILLASECFTDHISEALEINKQRKPLYAALSNNQSVSVSNLLILSEEVTYFYSRWMMFRTRDLRKAGIPVFCSEFTPMSQVPSFKSTFDEGGAPLLSNFEPDPLDEVARALKPKISKLDLNSIKEISLKWALRSYKKEPRFNCMSRHVLESIYETAVTAENNIKISKLVGLDKKTKRFIKIFLKSQVSAFSTLLRIDKKASKIQAKGVPIICNDVPVIIDLKGVSF